MSERLANPFTPGFGLVPPYMAGRDFVIRGIVQAFKNGPGDPNLTSLFVGARGTGKTALLSLLADEAQANGWVVARVSAVPGMLNDIYVRAQKGGAHLLQEGGRRLTSIGLAGAVSVEWENERRLGNWRSDVEDVLDQFESTETGLLITVDEVRADLEEMVQLASVYQHFVTERRKVALLMAGLPYQVSRVLNDSSISFLRRAMTCRLGRIDDVEIDIAMRETIEQSGRSIEQGALDEAVRAIDGFPYMMQLVGYRMWECSPQEREISLEDVRRGVARAETEMESRILEVTYRELSPGDRAFLRAMMRDGQESQLADIAHRLGKSSGYVAQYKRRLLEQGVIEELARGVVAFALPGWRKFMERRPAEHSR